MSRMAVSGSESALPTRRSWHRLDISFDRPISHLREYLTIVRTLLADAKDQARGRTVPGAGHARRGERRHSPGHARGDARTMCRLAGSPCFFARLPYCLIRKSTCTAQRGHQVAYPRRRPHRRSDCPRGGNVFHSAECAALAAAPDRHDWLGCGAAARAGRKGARHLLLRNCGALVEDIHFDCKDIVDHFSKAMLEFWSDDADGPARSAVRRWKKRNR